MEGEKGGMEQGADSSSTASASCPRRWMTTRTATRATKKETRMNDMGEMELDGTVTIVGVVVGGTHNVGWKDSRITAGLRRRNEVSTIAGESSGFGRMKGRVI